MNRIVECGDVVEKADDMYGGDGRGGAYLPWRRRW